MHGAFDSEFQALQGKYLTLESQLHKAQRTSEMLYKLCTAAVMAEKELQRNGTPQSFMNIIFQVESRKFVLLKSGKSGVLRSVFLIHY